MPDDLATDRPSITRCFALADGTCTHMACPRPRDPLRFCPWVLNGHITEGGRPAPSDGDDRPVNP